MSELQPTSYSLNSGIRRCPNCGSLAVRSSKEIHADRWRRLMMMKAFRCQHCRQRFYSWKWLKRSPSVGPVVHDSSFDHR